MSYQTTNANVIHNYWINIFLLVELLVYGIHSLKMALAGTSEGEGKVTVRFQLVIKYIKKINVLMAQFPGIRWKPNLDGSLSSYFKNGSGSKWQSRKGYERGPICILVSN